MYCPFAQTADHELLSEWKRIVYEAAHNYNPISYKICRNFFNIYIKAATRNVS